MIGVRYAPPAAHNAPRWRGWAWVGNPGEVTASGGARPRGNCDLPL